HWSPSRRDQGEHALYSAMLQRIDAVGGRVTGLLWWQGESEYDATGYAEGMQTLIASVRSDFASPNLPFYIVQLAPQDVGANNPASPVERNRLREIQRTLALTTPGVEVVAAIDQKL